MSAASTMTRKYAASARSGRGFTLIELMVVVLIVAILSVIAISSYMSYITRSKVRTAEHDLVALALNLENYMQRQLAYPVLTTSTTTDTVNYFKGWHPAQDADFVYTVKSSADTYKVVATGIGGSLTNCILTLDADGHQAMPGHCASLTSW